MVARVGRGGAGARLAGVLDGRTPKRFGLGTPRACLPEQTLDAVAPLLATCGITRVACVTGLDRIGIPVYLVVRPNARALAVAQGKGVTPAAARASGLLEAIESWHAEYATCPVRIESFAALAAGARVADPAALPRARDSSYHPAAAIPWVSATELASGAPVWVPYELVHANASLPLVPGSGAFVRSSNGLASGNTLAEALLHGLCELVERDAIALWERAGGERAAPRVNPASVDDPVCATLLDRLAGARVDALVWDLTADTGLAVFRVALRDRDAEPLLRPVPVALGMGCHLDPGAALARALTEAAQSRLTMIAGSRDDLVRARYRRYQSADAQGHYRALAGAAAAQARFRPFPARSTDTIEGDLQVALGLLRAAGVGEVVAVNLSRPGWPVRVARVLAPGLEGPSEHPHYAPGARARRVAAAGARP